MLLQESVQCRLLPYGKLAGLNTCVIDPEQGIDVIHRLRTDVRKLLDFVRGIFNLVIGLGVQEEKQQNRDEIHLLVRQLEPKLFNTRLDRIPASKTMPTSKEV